MINLEFNSYSESSRTPDSHERMSKSRVIRTAAAAVSALGVDAGARSSSVRISPQRKARGQAPRRYYHYTRYGFI